MENHFNCIYCYTNIVDGKKYVGQAVNFNKRRKQHVNDSYNKNKKYDHNMPFHRAIRKYGIENFKVKILKENLETQCLLNFWECYYIDKFNTLVKNKKGYNVSSGGSNGNNFAGKTEEEMNEIKAKLSEAHKGKTFSEETKQKMSDSKKDNYVGENHPMWNNGKQIAQYDKNMQLLAIYGSSHEAERQTGVAQTNIITCCKFHAMNCNCEEWFKTHKRDPRKIAGGFIWKYYEE